MKAVINSVEYSHQPREYSYRGGLYHDVGTATTNIEMVMYAKDGTRFKLVVDTPNYGYTNLDTSVDLDVEIIFTGTKKTIQSYK